MVTHDGRSEIDSAEDYPPLPDSVLGSEISPVPRRQEGDGAQSLPLEESLALARDEEMADRHKKDLREKEKKLKMAYGGSREKKARKVRLSDEWLNDKV